MTKPVPAQIDTNMPSLRKAVNAIALAVALITALAGPLGYGLVGYGNDSARASFRANLSANRVARYIYQNREMWQYQKSRLGDLIVLAEATDETGRHRITDNTGKLVLSEGDVAARFSLTRVAPIVVAEATVGFVAFTIPLDPLLRRIGLTALFSLLLSLGAYAAVRIFPLRVLDSALGALETANRTILEKNAVLEQQNHALRQRERDLQSTEAALKHRSDQLVEAQQLGKIGDWSYRLGDANIWWAPEIYDLLGYDPDSFVCSHAAVMAIYQGDGVRRVLNSQADVMHTGQVQSVDVKGRRGDGTVGDFAVTSKAMTDAEGRLIGFNGTIQDISARKTAEESLQKLAYYDPLTGLANRALFHNEINDLLTRCARTGSRGRGIDTRYCCVTRARGPWESR